MRLPSNELENAIDALEEDLIRSHFRIPDENLKARFKKIRAMVRKEIANKPE